MNNKLKLKKTEYEASNGKEIFLEYINDKNILFGLLRLRFSSGFDDSSDSGGCAIIRELHVYGSSIELGEKGEIQHKGIGKKLMKEAEKIAKQEKCNRVLVISGIGVRGYYRKLGYKLDREGVYMGKKL